MRKSKFFVCAAVVAASFGLLAACGQVTDSEAGASGLALNAVYAGKAPGTIVDWTSVSIPDFVQYTTINGVAWSGRQFAAVSGPNNAAYVSLSPDAVTWGSQQVVTGIPRYPSIIASVNSIFFVAVGSGLTEAAYSIDGTNWSLTTVGFGTKGAAYGEVDSRGLYVVGGQHGQGGWTNNLAAGFTTLTAAQTTFDNGGYGQLYINAVAFGDPDGVATFVLGGGRGHVGWASSYSEVTGQWNGVTDTEDIFSTPGQGDGFINSIAYGDGVFVAVGGLDNGPGTAAYSVDGDTWDERNTSYPFIGVNSKVNTVAYGAGYFVAGDNAGNIAYSSDGGVTWAVLSVDAFRGQPINSITFGNGKFVAVGGSGTGLAASCTP
jgi:hypothetical protein